MTPIKEIIKTRYIFIIINLIIKKKTMEREFWVQLKNEAKPMLVRIEENAIERASTGSSAFIAGERINKDGRSKKIAFSADQIARIEENVEKPDLPNS